MPPKYFQNNGILKTWIIKFVKIELRNLKKKNIKILLIVGSVAATKYAVTYTGKKKKPGGGQRE